MKIILCAGISVRTGTNYMGSIFSEIPEVNSLPKEYSKGEFPFFRPKVFINYENWFEEFNKAMFAGKTPNKEHFARYYGDSFLNYLKEEYKLDKDILFVKDPGLYNIDKFYDFFPDGKLIILKRNAPDLIASSLKASLQIRKSQSLKKKLKAKLKYYSGYSMYTYARAYTKNAAQLIKLRKKMKNNFLEIDYEELVQKPAIKIKEILNYCEINYDARDIENAVNAKVVGSSFFGAKKHSQHWGKLDKESGFKPIGRYKSWNIFNRLIYNKYADKSNRLIGYNQDV